jgi:tripartite-type tricarboxylate transporter receptor subunit TctC
VFRSTGRRKCGTFALKALDDPVLRENLTNAALEAVGGPPEELGRMARSDSDKYARLVKELGITAD